jgi:predicted phage terminase large subunit-like protein
MNQPITLLPTQLNKKTLTTELCKSDYFSFLQIMWHTIVKEELKYNWHIEYLCDELQLITERVIARKPKLYDLLITIPPGTLKSTLATIFLHPWAWTKDPSLKFISASYSADLALYHAVKSRDMIRNPLYKNYFHDIELKDDQDVKSNYENLYGGSRLSMGIGGTITGKHAHIILIDDPLNPKQALSDAERINANYFMDETIPTRKIDKKITPIIMIMQRTHPKDPAGHWLSKNGKKLKHICLPAEASDKISPARLKMLYKNNLLDPTNLDQEVIDELKIELGGYGASAQLQQDPKVRGNAMFKRHWFPIVDAVPSGLKVVRYWDMAATEAKKGKDPDFTAGGKLGYKNGIYYILDMKHVRESSFNTQKLIEQTAAVDGKGVFIYMEQEPGSSGKTVINDYTRYLTGYVFYGRKSTGSKTTRAHALSCQAEAGNVKLLKGDWNGKFLDEIELFPYGTHDDQVDGASGGFNELASATKLQIGRA